MRAWSTHQPSRNDYDDPGKFMLEYEQNYVHEPEKISLSLALGFKDTPGDPDDLGELPEERFKLIDDEEARIQWIKNQLPIVSKPSDKVRLAPVHYPGIRIALEERVETHTSYRDKTQSRNEFVEGSILEVSVMPDGNLTFTTKHRFRVDQTSIVTFWNSIWNNYYRFCPDPQLANDQAYDIDLTQELQQETT